MEEHGIVEEHITFVSGALRLVGILAYPFATRPCRAVLLCSPHPHFAGDMNNNVVRALARHLAGDAIALRFNYRGVGGSTIDLPRGRSVYDYWADVEETKDYRDAMEDAAAAGAELAAISGRLPVAVIGYSFGAILAMQIARHGFPATGGAAPLACAVGVAPPLTRFDFTAVRDAQTPGLLVSGAEDFVYTETEMARVHDAAGPGLTVDVMPGQDHFYRGAEPIICERVGRFVRGRVPRPNPAERRD